jgi:GTPase
LLLLIVDAQAKFGTGDRFVLDIAKKTGQPALLLLNKIDAVEKQKLLPLIEQYRALHDFVDVIPISALKRDGLDSLLDAVMKALPEGPRYFPKDQITERIAELHGSTLLIQNMAAIHNLAGA